WRTLGSAASSLSCGQIVAVRNDLTTVAVQRARPTAPIGPTAPRHESSRAIVTSLVVVRCEQPQASFPRADHGNSGRPLPQEIGAMKTTEQVAEWLKELKGEQRDLVTKQMVFGNTGAMNALKWVVETSPDADAVRLKINELQVTSNESITDELKNVSYGAMIEALKWVLRAD
ncbi:MAG: hypothetical protein JWP30_169, partial [Homoserinimonas sp.]|nr:hypothetical protein [Homoserinimonas sp.]